MNLIKKILIIVSMLFASILVINSTNNVTYAATSIENENISFYVTNKNKKNPENGYDIYTSNEAKVGYLLENYYHHQFLLGVEQIQVELKINDYEVMYPSFSIVNSRSLTLIFMYVEFNTLREGSIIFNYDSTDIYINGPDDFEFQGVWEMEIPKMYYTDIENLPITYNDLGKVTFAYTNKTLTANILFNEQTYQFRRTFAPTTDMSLFTTIEAYYINVNGDNPQIIISHGDKKYLEDILKSKDDKPAFVPHTIWNLKTNELNTQNKYATNVHVKQNKSGVMIAYLYIDEFIMDKIISAELSWTSRQKHSWINSILIGKYTDWVNRREVLITDDYLEYNNLTSDWQNAIPVWNIIRGIYQANKTYKMPRISTVNLNSPQKEFNISKPEIESYFRKTNKEFEKFKDDEKYKLFAFALQGGINFQGNYTEIYFNEEDLSDPLNLHVIEIVYETNGRLYTTKGDDMDLKLSFDEKLLPKSGFSLKWIIDKIVEIFNGDSVTLKVLVTVAIITILVIVVSLLVILRSIIKPIFLILGIPFLIIKSIFSKK